MFVIRIPFLIVQTSGFDVSKVEDHFLSKLFKFIEIIIILYILWRLGIEKESLRQILLKFI